MTLQELIKNVTAEEVGNQAFPYIPRNWTAYPLLPDLLGAASYSRDQIESGFTLSRHEVRSVVQRLDSHGGLALVPVWGYPRGVAASGNRKPLEAVFNNAERITKTLIECKDQRLSVNRLLGSFAIPHLGLSTLSKIFYFAGVEAEEGALLIYDQMVMRALHHHAFEEYGPWPRYERNQQNATYRRFIACTAHAAHALSSSTDIIEYALFREGQRLGPAPKTIQQEISDTQDRGWLHAQGFTVVQTWAARSLFSYRASDSGAITLRFGSRSEFTINGNQLATLRADLSGVDVALSTGPGSLQDWLDRHVTTIRITSYLAPVLVQLGHASRHDNRLKFFN